MDKEQIEDDFDFSRDQYYKLVRNGDEAIELMMDLARESEAPRAFEVLATMIKTNAEIADRLMDLQKKKKDTLRVEEPKSGLVPQLPNGVTNNNLFVGSTQELAKMIEERQAVKQNTIIDNDDNNG
jgi:hypothetical protein